LVSQSKASKSIKSSSKSIKSSKDANFSLVSQKILSQKMANWVGAQGLVKVAKNVKTTPRKT